MTSKLDINLLVKTTAEILRKNDRISLDGLIQSRKNQNNLIDQICYEFFRNYKHNRELNFPVLIKNVWTNIRLK